MHSSTSGNAHFLAKDERECFEMVKKLLSFLPSNNLDDPPLSDPPGWPPDENPELDGIVPADATQAYDVRDLVANVFDDGDFLEVQADFAKNIVVGFARLGGRPVGVVGNQPTHLAASWISTAPTSSRVSCASATPLTSPSSTSWTCPAICPAPSRNTAASSATGPRCSSPTARRTCRKIALIVRKSYGGAYIAMSGFGLGYDRVLAYPFAEIAVMGPEGAANIIFRREIGEAEDPEKVRQEKIEEYRNLFAKPYTAAKYGLVDVIIEPRQTRGALIRRLR